MEFVTQMVTTIVVRKLVKQQRKLLFKIAFLKPAFTVIGVNVQMATAVSRTKVSHLHHSYVQGLPDQIDVQLLRIANESTMVLCPIGLVDNRHRCSVGIRTVRLW